MNGETFDQDNIFDERSAFDAAPDPVVSNKPGKKTGKLPVWLWALMGGLVLLIAFVAIRVVGGHRSASNDDIAPITQSNAAPKPMLQSEQPAPAVEPDPAAASAPSSVPIPGDLDVPVAAAPTEIPNAGDTAAASATAPTAAAAPKAAAPTPPSASASPASAVPAAAVSTPTPAPAPGAKATDERLDALSNDLWRLKQQVASMEHAGQPSASRSPRSSAKAPSATSAKGSATAPTPIVGVSLKAIVDDNAWLQTESGETLSVHPGDNVPGIGVVKAVDPDSGTVRFTDGRVLH